MFRFRRWWLLCGAVLVGVVALNGVVNGVVDAKVRPAPRAVCVRGGATATDGVSGRGLVCVQTRVRGLRWRFQPAAVTTTTTTTSPTTTTTTTVSGVVAPVLVSVSASDGVRVTVAGMRPDTGVYSLQWVLQGSTFNTYQMARATSPSMNVPAGWFACNRTYTFRVFVMQADWQLADGHQTQNVTPHSTPFDVVTPACPAAAAPVAPLTCATGGACVVGDTGPGGGIVFYVHATGTFNCGVALTSTCKYLEVAPSGWNTGTDPTKLWAVAAHQSSDIGTITNDSPAYNNALGIGLGYKNSVAIVNQGNDTTTAAGAARAYGGGSQSDWYLPTTAELNLLCQWAGNVPQSVTTSCTGVTLNTGTGASGGFSAGNYWSSSELQANGAWGQFFNNGGQSNNLKSSAIAVRPVRAFGGTVACADGGVCAVGDTGPGGGVVYILSNTSGNTTGLTFEAARNDWDGAAPDGTARWCSASTVSIAGLGTAIGTGSSNSATIATTCASTGALDAAEYVRGKTIGGKTDWFLPSRDEALAIYTQRSVFIGNYAINQLSADTARYLTSTQGADVVNALGVFLQGSSFPGDSGDFSKDFDFSIRPVRSFTAGT